MQRARRLADFRERVTLALEKLVVDCEVDKCRCVYMYVVVVRAEVVADVVVVLVVVAVVGVAEVLDEDVFKLY